MLAIISDIHDNLPNLEKSLAFCKNNNITTLACCGDITNSETLEYLAKNFPHTIYLVLGNMELFEETELEQYPNIKSFGRVGGSFQYQGKLIGICHESFQIDKLAAKDQPDILFYGHSHIPWEETRIVDNKKIQIINPGNVSNTRYQPTFATYNPITSELKLHLLDEMK